MPEAPFSKKLFQAAFKKAPTTKHKRIEIRDLESRHPGCRLVMRVGPQSMLFFARCEKKTLRKVRWVQIAPWEGHDPVDGISIDAARECWREISRLVDKGIDPQKAWSRGTVVTRQADNQKVGFVLTFDVVAQMWLDEFALDTRADGRLNVPSWKNGWQMLKKNVLPVFGHMRIQEIGPLHIKTALKAMVERGAPVGANRCLGYVRRVFDFAVLREFIEENPAKDVKKPGDESGRRHYRAMDWDQVCAVWRAAEELDTIGGWCFLWMLLTTARNQAAYYAQWSEFVRHDGVLWWEIPALRYVEVDGERLAAPGQKALQPHALWVDSPLCAKVLDRLQAIREARGDNSPWLFPSDKKPHLPWQSPASTVAKIRLATGVQDVTFRMCRSSGATRAAQSGAGRVEIGAALHHREKGEAEATSSYVQWGLRGSTEKVLKLFHEELERRLQGSQGPSVVLAFPGRR